MHDEHAAVHRPVQPFVAGGLVAELLGLRAVFALAAVGALALFGLLRWLTEPALRAAEAQAAADARTTAAAAVE
ncbi:MAG TPA: hypothetical protein VGD67_27405 [Pseudonocardiaceae bacterium]